MHIVTNYTMYALVVWQAEPAYSWPRISRLASSDSLPELRESQTLDVHRISRIWILLVLSMHEAQPGGRQDTLGLGNPQK